MVNRPRQNLAKSRLSSPLFARLNINIPLLVFLILFLDVKFVVKIVAIIFISLIDRDWTFGFAKENQRSRLPLFYPCIILLAILQYLAITRNYSLNYTLLFSMGILQWLLSLLAIHHLRLAVDKDEPLRIHNTIKAFYGLNFAVSLFFLALLLFYPASLSYWGHSPSVTFSDPSAGDTIIGISFDASTVNATINCLGLIYFLYKKDRLFSLICLLVIILCTSNVTFFLTTAILGTMVLTVRSKKLRIRAILATLLLVVFYFAFSASNRIYIRNYFVQLYIINKNPAMLDSAKAARLGKDSIYSADESKIEKALSHLVRFSPPGGRKHWLEGEDSTTYPLFTETDYLSKPGKMISFVQTYVFLKSGAMHFLFGAGMGNFSSKLAFRAAGEKNLGTYPSRFTYIAPQFRYNHLRTFQFYRNSDASKHSVLNYPYSVYFQILGEYGVVGAALFTVLYMGWFAARYRRLSYGRYMTLILLAFFFMEYWFEFFSLIVIFELFMLLNIKEGRDPIPAAAKDFPPEHTPYIPPS